MDFVCECEICTRNRELEQIIKSGNTHNLIAALKDLQLENLNLQTELEHTRKILRGEWPRSVEILTQALENAKKQ